MTGLSSEQREALEVGCSLFGWTDTEGAMRHLEPVVESMLTRAVEAARAECIDDHGAWREEIAELKSDALMWQKVASAKVEAAERALVARIEAEVADLQTFMLLPAIAAARIRAALSPDAEGER